MSYFLSFCLARRLERRKEEVCETVFALVEMICAGEGVETSLGFELWLRRKGKDSEEDEDGVEADSEMGETASTVGMVVVLV